MTAKVLDAMHQKGAQIRQLQLQRQPQRSAPPRATMPLV